MTYETLIEDSNCGLTVGVYKVEYDIDKVTNKVKVLHPLTKEFDNKKEMLEYFKPVIQVEM